ncbi:hypothetical protein, partial [Salmonella sp. s51944]|uniref:hypothetical protein n=1 Tax=Salmonella sp. s51944 TaxID=3159655 RepID=UPI00397F4C24
MDRPALLSWQSLQQFMKMTFIILTQDEHSLLHISWVILLPLLATIFISFPVASITPLSRP